MVLTGQNDTKHTINVKTKAIMNIYYLAACLIVSDIKDFSGLASAVALTNSFDKHGIGDMVTSALLGTEHEAQQKHNKYLDGYLKSDSSTINGFTSLSNTENSDYSCPPMTDAAKLTQTQLINRLTAPCRYDRLERPPVLINKSLTNNAPIKISVRVYIYVLQNLVTSDLQFKVHGLIQMRFNDPRLEFAKYAPNRVQPIMGESSLRNLIWVPHIFLANEHNSEVLGTKEKDILTSINSDGTVIISLRIQATLFCWMKLQKFPFDEQFCPTVLESWMYNSSELLLEWEKLEPVTFNPKMHLTEYAIRNVWTNESIISAGFDDLRHGAFTGNYSSLSFTVHLSREVGYYVMDYFLPSIMIVAISWVSFWLQADQTPARTTLGCTTLLSFITLASSQENNLPKVSCIKISEVWFLGCTFFIFGSLVEFAFVNTIWRRKNSVEVKKVKSKYILKSTLTPNMKRHKIIDSPISSDNQSSPKNGCERYLSIIESPVIITLDEEPKSKFNSMNSIISRSTIGDDSENESENKISANNPWATMTPHEVSLWIDKKARFVFPLAFILFNAFFWTFVYCL